MQGFHTLAVHSITAKEVSFRMLENDMMKKSGVSSVGIVFRLRALRRGIMETSSGEKITVFSQESRPELGCSHFVLN